ncbi:MAG: MerR family transcriptional regulator, partial [Raoultibacter sp.]
MVEFSIGRMAALNCVSEKALRLYQQKGLLTPVRVDETTGYRYYSYEQCSTID